MTTSLALITGGSRGLGRALCEAFLAQGFKVIELSRSAPHPYSIRTDLSRPEQAAQAARVALDGIDARALDEFVCVANAATVEPIGPAARASASALRASLDTSLVSGIVVLAAVIDTLQALPGRKVLVNVTTGAAQRPHGGLSLYCAAKAGMEHFIRVVAAEQERQPHPFTAINVDPGALDTDMQASLRGAAEDDHPGAADMKARHARGELRPPAEVAEAIVRFVRSDALVGGERYRI